MDLPAFQVPISTKGHQNGPWKIRPKNTGTAELHLSIATAGGSVIKVPLQACRDIEVEPGADWDWTRLTLHVGEVPDEETDGLRLAAVNGKEVSHGG